MLNLDFSNVGVKRRVTLKEGVEWNYCDLFRCFDEYGLEADFKEGVFVASNDLITFRAFNDRNTIYEMKLSAVEEGKVRFWLLGQQSLIPGCALGEFEKENRELDIAAFFNKKSKQEKITVCEHVERLTAECSYTETLEMEMDRSADIIKFYVTVEYRIQSAEKSGKSSSDKEAGSRIKTMTLDNEITFDFNRDYFMEIMKKIERYCERKNQKISIRCIDDIIPGHCIYIPNTVVTLENFEIVFSFEKVRIVRVTKNIMNSTFYTDTLGNEYCIGTIVRETQKKTKDAAAIEEYGASELWKIVLPETREYIFCCGYDL